MGGLVAKSGAIALVWIFLIAFSLGIPHAEAQTYPTVTLTIERIQEVDPIDGFLGDWNWWYWVGTSDGTTWTWTSFGAPNGQDVTVGDVHTFEVQAPTFIFAITLCEGDTFSNDDVADISSGIGGGWDNSASNCDQGSQADPWDPAYVGTWDLRTETLSGHLTVSEPGGLKTSGDFDSNVGDENDANLWFTISDNYVPPVANAGANRQGHVGDSISFDGSGSTASVGSSIEEYAWDFDDDGSYDATGNIVSTSYTTKGSRTVTLRVTDSIGVTATDTTTVNIVNQAPSASFTFPALAYTTQAFVEFVDTSTDADGTLVSWQWDFRDGNTSLQRNPLHRFTDDGSYSVRLTVTDNDGDKDTVTLSVTILNVAPVAVVTVSPAKPTTLDTVTFTDASTDVDGTIVSWAWDFGDGNQATLQNSSHTYPKPGTYTVNLTVIDDDGASAATSVTVTVEWNALDANLANPVFLGIIGLIILGVALIVGLVWRRRRRAKGAEAAPAPATAPAEEPVVAEAPAGQDGTQRW